MSTVAHEVGERAHPRVTLAVLSLGGLAYAVLSSSIVPALPTIQHSLHASETGVAWLLTGYLLSASVGTAILGRLGDMYGKEHVLVWTLVLLGAGTLMAALVHSLPLLIAARVIQGIGGGIFPLAFGIIRDEFPRERVAGSIGLMSAILGIGAGVGIVAGATIVQQLSWQWLFWMPLAVIVVAAFCTWRFVPESPVRVPGRINWTAGALMSAGISIVLVAISETTAWGWGSARTLALLAVGLVLCAAWVAVEARSREPLIDMAMMRIRGVWTTNLTAFLLGAGMYSSFVIFPQFAQLPKSTGFGFGASVVVSGLYLLPSTIAMVLVGFAAGPIARRYGSRSAAIVGSLFAAASFGLIAAAHDHPSEMLASAALLGIGIGLAFAALGNLIVSAVAPHQTGAAGGMNTVMRTIGGALGGQLSTTFVSAHVDAGGLPTVTGFTETFWMATAFLVVCALAGLLIPGAPARRGVSRPATADAR
ncbi:MAG TPA: MFS transporter [Gaiellaceae bacterium]|nr:MFS transporter [Gaiellaceae bacterium]